MPAVAPLVHARHSRGDQSGRPGGGPVSGQVNSVRTSDSTVQTLDGGSTQPPQF